MNLKQGGGKFAVYSGGFDPLHDQHVERMIYIRNQCDHLTVIVESDEFVSRKHPVLLNQLERGYLIQQLSCVDQVLYASKDASTSALLAATNPHEYWIGPDHNPNEIPEAQVCKRFNVDIQVLPKFARQTSSTQLLNNYFAAMQGRASFAAYKPKYDNPPVTVSLIIESVIAGPDKVLIGKRLGVGYSDLFGGFLEPGESLEQAACREMFEETGIKISQYQGNFRYITSQYGTYKDGRQIVCVYFACQLDDISAFRPSDEIHEVEWVTSTPGDMHNKEDEMALHYYFLSRKKQR